MFSVPAVAGLVHEAPLHPSGEAGAPTPPQPRDLHLLQDPVRTLQQDLLGFVPVTSLERSLQPGKRRESDPLLMMPTCEDGRNASFTLPLFICAYVCVFSREVI